MEMNIAEINFAWAFAASLISDVLGNLCGISHFYHDVDAREDRSIAYSDVLARRQRQKNMRNFVRGSCWPKLVAVSGLNLRVCWALLKCPVLGSPRRGRVVTSKTKGKSVALDTLPDPGMPNEPRTSDFTQSLDWTSHPEF